MNELYAAFIIYMHVDQNKDMVMWEEKLIQCSILEHLGCTRQEADTIYMSTIF